MRALFLVFHGFSPSNGISKKISYQVDALNKCGLETELCYLKEEEKKYRMVGDNIIYEFGGGLLAKIIKRLEYKSIVEYIVSKNIKFVYVRYDHNASPITILLFRAIKKLGVQLFLEIPTFPYDNEAGPCKYSYRIQRKLDLIYRNRLMQYVDKIVTFSNHTVIFGRPTIQISNGIDFNSIKLRVPTNNSSKSLNLIAVAQIHYWHGFDRIIKGLAEYYKIDREFKVYLNIVGEMFGEEERRTIVPLIDQNNLWQYITLLGAQHGEDLDRSFDNADMAVGSLGRHRSNITYIKTLKNREYAARGFSFVYSEVDDDFESKEYILKVPADESSINIIDIVDFWTNQKMSPMEIRSSILELSWESQFSKVVESINIL